MASAVAQPEKLPASAVQRSAVTRSVARFSTGRWKAGRSPDWIPRRSHPGSTMAKRRSSISPDGTITWILRIAALAGTKTVIASGRWRKGGEAHRRRLRNSS